MSKTNKILLVLVIVLFLVLVSVFVWQTAFSERPYYAMLLRTGDLYFGQLTVFPFGLKNIYTVQVNTQNQQNPVSIQRFKNIFWGPEDYMKINRDEVVWMTKLDPQGQLARLIKTNPDLTPAAATQTPPAQNTVPSSGGTKTNQ